MSESLWRKSSLLFSPFAWLYGRGVSLRNLAYNSGLLKTHRLPIPVISIGNLNMGGTGKTPVTLSLARILRDPPYNLSPAVLSRGYKRRSSGYRLVSAGDGPICDWKESGDEPQLYASKLSGVPVAVDADRARGGRTLIEHFSPSVILLDDAFQHRRIQRDLDIVLLDESFQWQKERLLPAGYLREPPSALKRAHLIVLTHHQHGDEKSDELWRTWTGQFGENRLLACRTRPSGCAQFRTGEKVPLKALPDWRLIAFCGIAKPEAFLDTLTQLCADVRFLIRFPDHHVYKPKDVERLAISFTKEKADYLITTEKDAVKLGGLFQALPILVLEIEIEWLKGLDNLKNKFHQLLA